MLSTTTRTPFSPSEQRSALIGVKTGKGRFVDL
jgi:hypothetical protein